VQGAAGLLLDFLKFCLANCSSIHNRAFYLEMTENFCGKGSRLWHNECWMSSHSTVKILCHFHAAIYNVLSKGKQGMKRVHFWTGSGHLRQKCKEQQSLIADHLYTAHYKCECDCSCTNIPQFSTKSILVDVHQFK
jgi:hypothetical protein